MRKHPILLEELPASQRKRSLSAAALTPRQRRLQRIVAWLAARRSPGSRKTLRCRILGWCRRPSWKPAREERGCDEAEGHEPFFRSQGGFISEDLLCFHHEADSFPSLSGAR